MRIISIIFFVFLIIGCKHPESDELDRYNDSKESIKSEFDIRPSLIDLKNHNCSTIKMENEEGVNYVWIEINGLKLRFVFDTGASNISISPAEASVLYRQGTLNRNDILDIEYFQDATGRISEGTTINLRTVKIGDIVLKDVKATVVNNENAPLLLGQSVMERFGKIEIDNENGYINFN